MAKQVKSITCRIFIVEHGYVATWRYLPIKVENTYGNGMYVHAYRLIDDNPEKWDYDVLFDCRYRTYDFDEIVVEHIESMYGDSILLVTAVREYEE